MDFAPSRASHVSCVFNASRSFHASPASRGSCAFMCISCISCLHGLCRFGAFFVGFGAFTCFTHVGHFRAFVRFQRSLVCFVYSSRAFHWLRGSCACLIRGFARLRGPHVHFVQCCGHRSARTNGAGTKRRSFQKKKGVSTRTLQGAPGKSHWLTIASLPANGKIKYRQPKTALPQGDFSKKWCQFGVPCKICKE